MIAMIQTGLIEEMGFTLGQDEEIRFKEGNGQFSNGLLLIGCSGFRFTVRGNVPVPEESFFVYQSLANSVRSSTNWKSNFQYAVEVNGVRDVVVCGHEDCRIAQDSLKIDEQQELEDPQATLVQLREFFRDELLKLKNNKVRADQLTKLNVQFQTRYLERAIEQDDSFNAGSDVDVHGWFWSRNQEQFLDVTTPPR